MARKKIKQAVILAAGRGSRLGCLTNTIPKCMLKIGEQPIIFHQLAMLQQAGIEQIVVVTGYAHQTLLNLMQNYQSSLSIVFHFNPRWETANNIVSLACVHHLLEDGFILIESDVMLFNPLPSSLMTNNAMLLGHFKPGMVGSHVLLNNLGAVKVLKTDRVPNNQELAPLYKTVNVYAFHNNSYRMHIQHQIAQFIEAGKTSHFYEYAIAQAIEAGMWKPKGVVLEDSDWCEIDTPEDYERFKKKKASYLM